MDLTFTKPFVWEEVDRREAASAWLLRPAPAMACTMAEISSSKRSGHL